MATVEVPDGLAEVLRPLLEHVASFEAVGRAGEQVDFRAREREMMELVAAVEGRCTARMLESLDMVCPRVRVDGKTYRRMNNPTSKKTYFGMRSTARVDRHIYRLQGARNGPTIVPMELRAGIVEGVLTPAAAEGMAALGQAMPSREAADTSERLGVLPYSRSEHFRAAVQVGVRWGELRELYEETLVETMTLPDEVAAVSVSVDRVSIPMREPRPHTEEDIDKGIKNPVAVNLRMAFASVLTLYDADGGPLSCIRYAHVPTGGAEDMKVVLRDDLGVLLQRRPGLPVVALADGASDMQGILDYVTAGRQAATVVDLWHLLEKLGEAASAVGEANAGHVDRWRALLLARDDAVFSIGRQLDVWATPYAKPGAPSDLPARPEPLHAAITYVTNQGHRMRYASLHAQGLPIGSGTVEATGKTIMGTRMRRPGCRWIEPGAQPVLALRALGTSVPERWEAVMEHVTHSYIRRVEPLGAKPRRAAPVGSS